MLASSCCQLVSSRKQRSPRPVCSLSLVYDALLIIRCFSSVDSVIASRSCRLPPNPVLPTCLHEPRHALFPHQHAPTLMISPAPHRCFSTLGCPDLSFAAAIDLARYHAIPAIEVRCLEGAPLEPDLFSTSLPAPDIAADMLRKAGVSL